MAYLRRVVKYEPVEVDPADLMTETEAADFLEMTKPGLISAITRGALTEIIDDERSYHGRRLLLRREVEQFKQKRDAEP